MAPSLPNWGNETGEALRKAGAEFGATTGRPRRCGWMDLVALKFACMINGVTKLIITKADILDEFSPLQAGIAYTVGGKESAEVTFRMTRTPVQPVYKSFDGWNVKTSEISSAEALPQAMKTYFEFIKQFTGVPVSYVSNGPGREQIISL